MDRRKFLGLLGATGAGAAIPVAVNHVNAATTAPTGDVVVIGGGMAGAAAAKYLRVWGGSGVNVTLLTATTDYTSNIMSNMVVTGERSLSSLKYSYATLQSKYGVRVVQGVVSTLPTVKSGGKWTITHSNGTLTCDQLVVAPGLEFAVPSWLHATTTDPWQDAPHAWNASAMTTGNAGVVSHPERLHELLEAIPVDSTDAVVITIPVKPFRCPPGPYERSCVIADWLRVNRPGTKLVVLDGNANGIQAQAPNFWKAFQGQLGNAYTVDYYFGVSMTSADPVAGGGWDVSFSGTRATQFTPANTAAPFSGDAFTGTLRAAVLNPIVPQRAPQWLGAGLLSGSWAPIKPLTFESTLTPDMYVVGDAASIPAVTGTSVPKAGHIGNQEGKTAAEAIVRKLSGETVPATSVVLNSACYTPISLPPAAGMPGTATWLSAVYQYDSTQAKMVVAPGHPLIANSADTENYSDMLRWFNSVMGETFA